RIHPNIISVTPDSGTVGCLITVSGNGFGATEYIGINFGTTMSRGTTTAASNGSWTVTFTINTQKFGTTTVEAAGVTTPIYPTRTLKILPKVILVSPFSGTVGATITIGGNGFGASSSIRIKFGLHNTITTITSDNRGSFTTSFTINLQSYGTKTVTACDDTLVGFVEATSTAKILQKVTSITPTTGIVGTLMTVSGNGYGAGENIRIEFGTTATMSGVVNPSTDGNGSFTCSFYVDTQVYGSTSVIAWSDTLTASEGVDVKSHKDFKITPILIMVSPTAGTVGAEITVAGNGFGNAEVISIKFGNTDGIGTTSTESCGSFTITFTINTQKYGTTTITASGGTTGVTAIGTVSIHPNIISISPTIGTVGALITVAGNGFDNTEEIRIHLGITTNIVTCSAEANGSWTTWFTIDTQPYGTTTIITDGATTPIKPEGTITILPKVILVSPFSGTVGTTITVGGNGFGATSSIHIKFGLNSSITTVISDNRGSWTTTFTIDLQFYGTKTVTAYDDTLVGLGVEATSCAKILPKVLSISPTGGTVGTLVTIRGNGYGTSEAVRIAFGTTPTSKLVTSNIVGSFTTTFSIDTQAYGTTSVVAWSLVDGGGVSSYLDFKIDQTIILVSPKSGTVGELITVSGNGFGRTETIRIFFGTKGTAYPIATTITNVYGSWTTQFTIDTQIYGTTTIEAKGTTTGVSAYGSITVQPFIISITPKSGTVGSLVTVSGNGFGSTESIRIHFGATMSIVLTTSVANGSFTTSFTINTQGYGTTTITADGIWTPIKPTGTFTILPRIIYTSPLSGTVGTEISIRGNGFGRLEMVNIQFGTHSGIVSTQATELGSWTSSFTINTQPYGSTTITASDATNGISATTSVKIINRIIPISTGTATVSTVVTVCGDGYGSSEPIRINFGTTVSITEWSADVNGWFETTFTVNNQAYGNRTIKATGRTTGTEDIKPFFIIGRVYNMVPTTGTVGCVVTVNADGYGQSDIISIELTNSYSETMQSRKNMAGGNTSASSDGTFTTVFTVNESPYGIVTVSTYGIRTDSRENKIFTIYQHINSITPITGAPGEYVAMTGSGYTPSETIRISFGADSTLALTTASGVVDVYGQGGTFSAVFTVPIQEIGSKTIIAYGLNSQGSDTTSFKIGPAIEIFPIIGTVGSIITVNGRGYKPDETVKIDFGEFVSVTTVTASVGVGTFSTTFTVLIQPGTVAVAAFGNTSGVSANAMFTMKGKIELTPSQGSVGTIVSIYGSGFGVNEKLDIDFGTTINWSGVYGIDVGAKGTFTVTNAVDTQPYGITGMTATGRTSTHIGTSTFIINPAIVLVSPTTGTVGSSVDIFGNGYNANQLIVVYFGTGMPPRPESEYLWTLGGATMTTSNTNQDGSWTASFTIDWQVYGTTTILARDNNNRYADNVFIIQPNIWIAPILGTVGSEVLVRGNGYSGDQSLRVSFGTTITRTQTIADTNGSLTVTFTVDTQPYATKTVTVKQLNIGIEDYESFNIEAAIIEITPSFGTVGLRITVKGNGGVENRYVGFDFGNRYQIAIEQALTDGSFESNFIVNSQPYGTKTVVAKHGGVAYTAQTKTFFINPSIIATPLSGSVGTIVTVDGTGYLNSENIKIDFGSMVSIVPCFSSSLHDDGGSEGQVGGTFSITFTVDSQPAGTRTILGYGTQIQTGDNKIFTIIPNIYGVNPQSGTVGSLVTIFGQGYMNNEELRITFGKTTTIGTKTTDGNGSFLTSFTIDTQVYGTTTIEAVGITTGVGQGRQNIYRIQPKIISCVPSSGTVGTVVSIKGNGFGATEPISVDFGTKSAMTSSITEGCGSFTAYWTVDNQKRGVTSIIANGNNTGIATQTTFEITSEITITPVSGTVGTVVNVSGGGFCDSGTITIKFGANNNIGSCSASSAGSWTTSFVVDLQPIATKTVVSTDNQENSASAPFVIVPMVTMVLPSEGTIGSLVEVRGNGYGSAEGIDILFGTNGTRTSTTTDGQGSWTTTFTINTQKYGTTTVLAVGIASNGTATGAFGIRAYITITPANGTVGSWITVTGNGFAVEVIKIDFGTRIDIFGNPPKSSSQDGTFTVSFTVDVQAAGTTTVTAKSLITTAATNFALFTITPDLYQVSPTTGTVGSTVTIYGSGYSATQDIQIEFGTGTNRFRNTVGGTKTASTYGTFTASFTIDTQPAGTTTVKATSVTSGVNNVNIFGIRPNITYRNPGSGLTKVGSTVTIAGNGFAAGEQVGIDFGNRLTIAVTTTDNTTGSFTATFQIDTQRFGATTITARGISSGFSMSDGNNGYFSIQQQISSPAPTCGAVGTIITITGNGYGGTEAIRLAFGTNPMIAEGNASANGSFTITFTIDSQEYGFTDLEAIGSVTGASSNSKKPITIQAKLYLVTPNIGTVGTMVTVYGNGFESGNSTIAQINFGMTVSRVENISVSNNGTWTASFTIDTQGFGTTTINAYHDTNLSRLAEYPIGFKITGNIIYVSPLNGTIGSLVSIAGNGFGKSQTVTILFGTKSNIKQCSSDGTGLWTTSWTVDTQAYGTTTISASDSSTAFAATFTYLITAKLDPPQPGSGTVGTIISLTGYGYGASGAVHIGFGNNLNIKTVSASGAGSWTTTFTIDVQKNGTTTITATGVNNKGLWTQTFIINPNIISVYPTDGPIDTIVTVKGNGFGATESVRIDFGGNIGIATVTSASDNGSFTITFTVDDQARGSATITATGLTTGVNAIKLFFIKAGLKSMTPIRGTIGTVIVIEGAGYNNNGGIIRVDFGTTMTIADATLSSGGTFSVSFTTDVQPTGTTTVMATEVNTPANSGYKLFDVGANIVAVIPSSGSVGTLVTVYANGYGSTESVRIAFGGNLTITTVSSIYTGSITSIWTVDKQPYGTTTITVIGLLSGKQAVSVFKIMPGVISVSPDTGTVGTTVTVVADGFLANEDISVYFGTDQVIFGQVAAAEGSFTATFAITTQPAGSTTVLVGAVADANRKAWKYFDIMPNLTTIEPISGTVGSDIVISGDGFGKNEQVRISFGSTVTKETYNADTTGYINPRSFVVNTQPYGTATVVGYGITTQRTTSLWFYKITQDVYVAPVAGTVGTVVAITGTGYYKTETIKVDFGTHQTITAGVSTDGNGMFTTTFTIDTQKYGTTTVKATGITSGLVKTTMFAIQPQVYPIMPTKGTVGLRVTVHA
ncbi:hypothetical protein COZ71_07525, partial [Candidatus Desantisbacteria bacterium CG_4_8_14_3_um_filter_40_12]